MKEVHLIDIAKEIDQINSCLSDDYQVEDGHVIMSILKELKAHLARTSVLYSQAEYLLNVARYKASKELPDSKVTKYNDMIKGMTANEQKVFRLVERTNAAIVHIMEVLRSQLSYLKEEVRLNNTGDHT